MDLGLSGKVVIITGGAGAIGSATARCFLQEGASVAIADSDVAKGRAVEEELSHQFSSPVRFFPLDLRDETSIRDFVHLVVTTYDGIDIIVNNAAIFFFNALAEWTTFDKLDEHYHVGLRGPAILVHEAWRRSERSRGGSVITVSSIAGHVGEPNALAYTSIKAAQKGFTLSCAIEMSSYGGWAVTVSPGHTWTPVHQKRASIKGLTRQEYEHSSCNIQSTMFGRFLEPQEVGEWITIAASRLGKPLTGQDLKVTFGIEAGGFNRQYETAFAPTTVPTRPTGQR